MDPYSHVGQVALSFNDVVLTPLTGSNVSTSDISLATEVVQGVRIQLPIVTAAMDTVTEAKMAIAIARLGGLGVIHRGQGGRDLTDIGRQAEEVQLVKRYQSGMVVDPVTVPESMTIREVRELMKKYSYSGFPVVKGRKLVGLVTNRDHQYEEDDTRLVGEVMTPRDRLQVGNPGTTREEATDFFRRERKEKLPLVDKDNNIVGMYTSKDVDAKVKYPNASLDNQHRLLVGAAVGVFIEDTLARAEALINAGVDILVMDVKNGHTAEALATLKALRERWPDVPVMPGNVITPDGVRAQIECGATAVKVGIGVASICTSTDVTGVGLPQFSTVLECAAVAKEHGIPVIADGGFRGSSDIVKALAAGASTIMTGRLVAGTDEAPSSALAEHPNLRGYRGMGSQAAQAGRYSGRYKSERVVEGVEGAVPYQGSVKTIIDTLERQIRAGLLDVGVSCISELWAKAHFRQVTTAAQTEAQPHDVIILTREGGS